MSKDLTQGRPFRVLLQFSLPVIAGNLFQLFYTLADTVIVGRTLGAQALAAVGSTTIVIYFVLCFVQGFTGGFGICLAQRFGARRKRPAFERSGVVAAVGRLCRYHNRALLRACSPDTSVDAHTGGYLCRGL